MQELTGDATLTTRADASGQLVKSPQQNKHIVSGLSNIPLMTFRSDYKEDVDLTSPKDCPVVLLSIRASFKPLHTSAGLGCWKGGPWKTPSTHSLSVVTGDSCCPSALVSAIFDGYTGEEEPVEDNIQGGYSACKLAFKETAV